MHVLPYSSNVLIEKMIINYETKHSIDQNLKIIQSLRKFEVTFKWIKMVRYEISMGGY